MSDGSNTAGNSKPGRPFTKGDPRINRKGRPRSFDALRELALEIAHEPATVEGGRPLVINGKAVTTTEVILRQWARSKDPRRQQAFMEIAFGKVPDEVKLSGAVRHDVIYTAEDIAEARRILGDAGSSEP